MLCTITVDRFMAYGGGGGMGNALNDVKREGEVSGRGNVRGTCPAEYVQG